MNNAAKPRSLANWLLAASPFLLFHVAAVIGVFLVPFSWGLFGLCMALYAIRMFGITAGYHRYFSHRTYKMNRVAQFVMAFIGTCSIQKGVLWWAANHRLHHRHSDTPQDIHSPIQSGFWWSHVGWILSDKYNPTRWDQIQDLAKFPELRLINRFHLVPPILMGVAVYLIGGWDSFVWGYLVSTVLLWHGTFTINSLSHVFGTRRYATTDTSRNNPLLALVTLGEGWHNNHHCYMSSTNQGFYWYEFDISYYAIKALSFVGVTYDLRKAPLELLEGKKLSQGAEERMPRRAGVA